MVYPGGVNPWYLLTGVIVFFGAVTFGLFMLCKFYRVELDKADDRLAHSHNRNYTLVAALETIRDMGPVGPDPLPPCRFCKQGPGHWIDPQDKNCPAVFARSVLFSLNRPPGQTEEDEDRIVKQAAEWWKKNRTFG